MFLCLRVIIGCFFYCLLWADSPVVWFSHEPDQTVSLHVDMFLSSTCPHCQNANAFFRDLEQEMPWLHVSRYFINEDKQALIRFSQFLAAQQENDFAVPSIFFCNVRWVGFDSALNSGKDLVKGLKYCRQQITKQGQLTSATKEVLERWANANYLNTGVITKPSTTHYLLVVSILDMLSPCSLFGLAAFFAFLFIAKNERQRLVGGLLYSVAVVISHYVQQTQPSFVFTILPVLRGVAILLGLWTGYLLFQHYYKKVAMQSKLFFSWLFLFALVLQLYQQTCVMNWSYIFEQWLANQQASLFYKTTLQVVYQLMYLLPMLALLLAYCFAMRFDFFARYQSRLASFGLIIIAAISLFLIVYPVLLTSYFGSAIILLFLIILAILLKNRVDK